MRRPRALVLGSGVAGLAAAHRLAMADWRVTVAGSMPAKRIVTVDRSVAELLELEYGRPLLREAAPRLVGCRTLHWRAGAMERIVDRLLVFDLRRLVNALGRHLAGRVTFTEESPDATAFDGVIAATGRSRRPLLASGARTAHVWTLPFAFLPEGGAFLASGDAGWVFATPAPENELLVQLVLPGGRCTQAEAAEAAADVLDAGPYADVACQLRDAAASCLDATPCFAHPVEAGGRIRAGDAASAGDPLAGEGVGRALRSAILAAATLLRAAEGDAARSFGFYAGRTALAHATHLRACSSFYEVARCHRAFLRQIAGMQHHVVLLEGFASSSLPPLHLVADGCLPTLVETT